MEQDGGVGPSLLGRRGCCRTALSPPTDPHSPMAPQGPNIREVLPDASKNDAQPKVETTSPPSPLLLHPEDSEQLES